MNDRAIDATIATGGVTYPFWVQYLDTGLHTLTLFGGLMLILLRLPGAARDFSSWYRVRRSARRRAKAVL